MSSREGKIQCCLSLLYRHLQGMYVGQCTDSSLTSFWTDGASSKDEHVPLVILQALRPVILGWNRDGLNLNWGVTLWKRKILMPLIWKIHIPWAAPTSPYLKGSSSPDFSLCKALYFIYTKISVRDTQILITFSKNCLIYGVVPKFIQVNSSKS